MISPETVGAVLVCLYLPVPFIMLWIHEFHRRQGNVHARSFVLHGIVYVGLVAGVAALYRVWPMVAWPWHLALRAGGGVLIVAALVLLALTYRVIDSWTAMAGPQLTGGHGRRLHTSGVYGVVRHPRYTVLIIGSVGNFLLTGFPLLLAASAVTTALVMLVVRIEERELIDFFGDAYRRYRSAVPALFPAMHRRHNPTGGITTPG